MQSDEQLIAIVSTTGALKREIAKVRDKLQQYEEISEFSLVIEATGHVHNGDVKIVFKIAKSAYGLEVVEGNEIASTLEEFIRRHGWKKRNAPILLTADKSEATLEVPPF